MECIAKYCNNLSFLNIQSCKFTDDSLHSLTKYNTKLTYFNCSWCKNITKNGLLPFLDKSYNLEELNLAGCKINSEVIDSISKLPLIKELVLNWCNNFSTESFNNLINEKNENILGLSLYGCLILDESNILSISKKCINIKKLNLEWCKTISNHCLIQMSKNFKNITELNLAFSANIDDYGFEQFSLYCCKTEMLILRSSQHITNLAVYYIMKNLTNLKFFNIEKCPLLRDEGLAPIYEYGKNLIILEIGNKYEVSDITVTNIIKNCSNLKKLCVSSKILSNHSLLSITKYKSENFKHLVVSNSNFITIEDLEIIFI